jgi:hypothetical protein
MEINLIQFVFLLYNRVITQFNLEYFTVKKEHLKNFSCGYIFFAAVSNTIQNVDHNAQILGRIKILCKMLDKFILEPILF